MSRDPANAPGELTRLAEELRGLGEQAFNRWEAEARALAWELWTAVRLWSVTLRRLDDSNRRVWVEVFSEGGEHLADQFNEPAVDEVHVDLLSSYSFGDIALQAYAALALHARGAPLIRGPRERQPLAWRTLIEGWCDVVPTPQEQRSWRYLDVVLVEGRNRFIAHRISDHLNMLVAGMHGIDVGRVGQPVASSWGGPPDPEEERVGQRIANAEHLDGPAREALRRDLLERGFVLPRPNRAVQAFIEVLALLAAESHAAG